MDITVSNNKSQEVILDSNERERKNWSIQLGKLVESSDMPQRVIAEKATNYAKSKGYTKKTKGGKVEPLTISQPTISAYIGGTRNFTELVLESILAALNETFESFFTPSGETKTPVVEREHIAIIPDFTDKPRAKRINVLLLEMEKLDFDAVSDIELYVDAQVQLLRQLKKKEAKT